MTARRFVACPQCARPVEWAPESRWRPFCSARCKTIDLGAWAAEAYRVPAEEAPDADDTAAAPDGDAAERLGRRPTD
jgi:endogenous inhibitor of DNA gyrase (YacG/DUF329 family)